MSYVLNSAGYSHAKSLVSSGKISTGSFSKPSLSDFDGNVSEFAKFHLAKDPDGDPNSAGTYHYPYGRSGEVYRSAVANAKSRASAQGETAILTAATNLFNAIENKEDKSSSQKTSHKADLVTLEAYSKLDYTQPEDNTQGVPISGFAIHEGRFKDVINISKDEFANIEKSMRDIQLRIDHGDSVRDVIGKVHVAQAEFDGIANKPGVFYKASIDDAEIGNKVQKNLVNDVSIGFDLYPECSVCGEDFRECEHWFDEAHINAKDMDVFELSIVTRGADADAKASAQNFKAQFNDKIQKHPKEDVNNMNFTEGGKSMPEKPEDNKMVDIGEMVTKLSDSEQKAATAEAAKVQAEQELAAMKQEKEALEQEKEALRVEKEAAENKATDFEEKFTTTSTKLSDKQLTDKKTEVLSIVEDKLAKNLITEEQKDAEVETLMKVEDLQPIKDLVAQFDKPKARQDGKIPEIQNGTKQMGATTDKVDYDKLCKDPKFVQAMVHEIFKYDRVYHAPRKDKQPQASYMGLRKNNLDASSVNL